MLEIKVTIEAKELSAAINHLAEALGNRKTENVAPVQPTVAPQPQPQMPVTPQPQMPVTPQPPVAPAPPAAPANIAAPTPTVPLAAPPQYTTDQIMTAGATLMDAGKINELTALLRSFGVEAVVDLKPEQLGAFATAMRELGAKI